MTYSMQLRTPGRSSQKLCGAIEAAGRDDSIPLGGHTGNGAGTAPGLDDDIMRDRGPGNLLPSTYRFPMSKDGISHLIEEIGFELLDRCQAL